MKPLFRSSLLSLAVLAFAATLHAQARPGRSIAERLGHPAGTKLLILHADDVGVSHSVDAATFDALEKGVISSASIMMPTPWVTEVATWAKAHPDADLGLHLTLTSEWETYRWGSIASSDRVPTLHDADGTFPRGVEPVATRASLADVDRELRAQVDRALAMGIRPTHVDSHMGALFTTPALIATYTKVARDYSLPFLGLRAASAGFQPPITEDDLVPDAIVIADEKVPRDRWAQFYLDAIANLKPGLTEIIVHLGYDDAELRAVMVGHEPYGSAWRQRDYDVVNSEAFKKALKDNKVVLVTWRQLRNLGGRT